MRFKRSRRGVEAKLEPAEAEVLAQCAAELLELLGTEEVGSDDPLEALVGLPPGDVSAPDDPALAQLHPLVGAGGKLVLDRDEADAWLSWLNDIRLVLGTRLEVTEDTYDDSFDPDDPRAQLLGIYGWLGWLQESLISCLEPRSVT